MNSDIDEHAEDRATEGGFEPSSTDPGNSEGARPTDRSRESSVAERMKFTPSQKRAIEHTDGNLQLIACAGSGKTEVVARRVVELLRPGKPDSVLPRNIIAFTFTEKAAAELKERIHERCTQDLGNVVGLAEMYVGTIHGWCLDLLKTEVPHYLKFDVLNEVQQTLFIDRHSSKSGLTKSKDLRGKPLRRWIDTGLYVSALSILREAALDQAALDGCSLVEGLKMYQQLLDDRRHLDYSEILEKASTVLEGDSDLRRRIAERVRHVIVDEYQDVNPVQERIVRALHELGGSLCVVGDDDQVLYQWRGSEVQNILTFGKRYSPVERIRLEENFRSSEGIVETARAFIEKNSERLQKKMSPVGAQAYEPGDIIAVGFESPEEEAAHIVRTCKALRGTAIRETDGSERGISWSDMAILLRSVSRNAAPITAALQKADIPFVVVGMNELFGTAEAQAARALFYFMAAKPGFDADAVQRAWERANTGVSTAELRAAIRVAERARADMSTGEERFSVYSPQRVFLSFLENAGIREERVPGERARGQILFYNLGKFSQLISDFEAIHFLSEPPEKYQTFAKFLEYQAEGAYPEGWQNNQYANPDAVRIMTVHQAKGMQWPVVFVPALVRNRFPAAGMGGRSVWHLIPPAAVQGQARYRGTLEDERRLFYVAMTRAQKFLHMTWAPIEGANNRYTRPSEFWENVHESNFVKRQLPDYSRRKRLPPMPKAGLSNVTLTFSDIKYFFECPYQFKLRILYGFNAPIHEALGYGKSLHDALAELHARVIRGEDVSEADVPQLVATHLHTPYAYKTLREQLERAAKKVLVDYVADNKAEFANIELSEKPIEVNMGDGVSVVGRIDLVRRKDTDKTTIVDLKSTHRAQANDVTETQLHIYALGYYALTGSNADCVEIYNLDERVRKPKSIDEEFLGSVQAKVKAAAGDLRQGKLDPMPSPRKCAACDHRGMCAAAAVAA